MVEMRYVWGDEPCGENIAKRVKVLQYRESYEDDKKKKWTEWNDVPVVEDIRNG